MVIFMGLYWVLAAMVIRGAGLISFAMAEAAGPPLAPPRLNSSARVLFGAVAVACVWVAIEYLWGIVLTGFPWGFLGHSQSPLIAMCQIADITGVYGISFWVVLINAIVAMIALHPPRWRQAMPAAATVAATLAAIASYGAFRISQNTLYPGPRIFIVQPNDPTERGGKKNVTQEQSLA